MGSCGCLVVGDGGNGMREIMTSPIVSSLSVRHCSAPWRSEAESDRRAAHAMPRPASSCPLPPRRRLTPAPPRLTRRRPGRSIVGRRTQISPKPIPPFIPPAPTAPTAPPTPHATFYTTSRQHRQSLNTCTCPPNRAIYLPPTLPENPSVGNSHLSTPWPVALPQAA